MSCGRSHDTVDLSHMFGSVHLHLTAILHQFHSSSDFQGFESNTQALCHWKETLGAVDKSLKRKVQFESLANSKNGVCKPHVYLASHILCNNPFLYWARCLVSVHAGELSLFHRLTEKFKSLSLYTSLTSSISVHPPNGSVHLLESTINISSCVYSGGFQWRVSH